MIKKVLTLMFVTISLLGTGCTKKVTPIEPEEDEDSKLDGTITERLTKLKRVKEFKRIGGNNKFENVYSVKFEQYIDHNNKDLGTFSQKIEFGFNGFDLPNVYVSEGYNIMYDGNYSTELATGQNEIAFLLGCNYIFVEHRYFGDSLPVEINHDDKNTWKYLNTEQAANDAHEIVRQFKRILDGKWVSTGISKGGMTTELFAYYHPGDMDLYVPYVAPFCTSYADMRMMEFIYEEAGDLQYGESKAAKIRNEVLQFQMKVLEYRDVLAPRFYEEAMSTEGDYSSYATQDILFDVSVLEFGVGFWQYYQPVTRLENVLNLKEETESEITKKQNSCYNLLTSIVGPSDFALNGEFHSYYIQAYQELGNYGYDFHYLRDAGANLAITEEQETDDLCWKLVLYDEERELEQKGLMNPKINNMLETTDLQFILLYGSSDPWHSVRPTDVTGKDNISIYVNTSYPHTTVISNFPKATKNEIINKIKVALDVQ